jgi:hypothetical protein
MIDRDKLKKYINSKYSETHHVNEIKSISIQKVRINRDDIDMIKVDWLGWKVVRKGHKPEYTGTWYYRCRMGHFNLEVYGEWLVEVREEKLKEIGI